MSNIIEGMLEIFSKVLRTTKAPNNVPFIINENVPATGKEFNLYKELGGNVPNNIEIYSSQNFTVKFSVSDKSPDRTWPRTLVLGAWHQWIDEGWYRITITPSVAADIDAHISTRDKGSFVTPRGKKGGPK